MTGKPDNRNRPGVKYPGMLASLYPYEAAAKRTTDVELHGRAADK